MANPADDLNAAFTAGQWLAEDLKTVMDMFAAAVGVEPGAYDWAVEEMRNYEFALDCVMACAAADLESL